MSYLTSQIITYLGNKRKLLKHISNIIDEVKCAVGGTYFTAVDAFSGSGIVARLLKTKVDKLYVNDIAHYSRTLNQCYLSTPTNQENIEINNFIRAANLFVQKVDDIKITPWIQKHWAPSGEIGKKR